MNEAGAMTVTSRRCVAASATAVASMAMLYLVAVRTLKGQIFERVAANGRSLQPLRVRGAAWILLDTISAGSLAAVLVVVVGVALWARRPRSARTAAVVVIGSVGSTELLKLVILTRPDLAVVGDPNSFPSGHTTVAVSLVVACLFVVPPGRRGLVALVGTPYAIGIGIGTVIVGWHRPSDVLGAWLMVGAWAFAALGVLHRRSTVASALVVDPGTRRDMRPRGAVWPVVLGLSATAVGVVAVLLFTTSVGFDRQATTAQLGQKIALAKRAVAFAFSSAAIAALAVVEMALLLRVPPPVEASG